jgi:ADP-heptose:LPS heptosyltransferase
MKFDIFGFLVNFLIKNKKIDKLEHIPMDDVHNILLMSNTAIGDTLFNTPVFRSLKLHYPDKKLIVLLNPTNYKLFETNKYIDDIVLYDGKWKKFFQVLKVLKTKKIDITFILHSNEPQATPLALLSNSKYIIKIPNDKNEYNKFHTNLPTKSIENKHGTYDRLKQLEYIGINENNPRTELYIMQEWSDAIEEFFTDNKINQDEDIIIGFQIGASTVSRMWFEERWIELGNNLLNMNEKIKIILTGSPDEKNLTSAIYNNLNHQRVFDCAGQFKLTEAAALIGKLNVLITPDTGPMHIAAALKVPTIGFFIAANWQGSNPCHDTELHLYIQKEKTCLPCIGKRCKFQECMYQITVDDVILKLKELNRGII